MIGMIMELMRNTSFTVITSDSQQNRLEHLSGINLGTLLFTIRVPFMICSKYTNADALLGYTLLAIVRTWKRKLRVLKLFSG